MARVLVLVLARDTWARNRSDVVWLYGLVRGPAALGARIALAGVSRLALSRKGALVRAVGSWAAGRPSRRVDDRLHTFRHLLATEDFDYLLRTNVSTYVHLPGLEAFLRNVEPPFYGGPLGALDGMAYVSGTGMLLSRDLVEVAATDPAWDYDVVDDVALGRSMRRHGIEPRSLPRADVLTSRDLAELTPADVESLFFVRCKGRGDDRAHDIAAMRRLDEIMHE